MDFLTIDMVKMHCRIELYDPDPDRQAEIDKNIKEQANKAEQEVYSRIGRDYFNIIKEWGEVPPAIKQAALILTSRGVIDCPYEDGDDVKMLLQPYKKQKNNKQIKGTMEDKKPIEVVEEYKRRISDLIDEAEKAIGYPIETCEIEKPLYYVTDGKYHRKVCFNIKL